MAVSAAIARSASAEKAGLIHWFRSSVFTTRSSAADSLRFRWTRSSERGDSLDRLEIHPPAARGEAVPELVPRCR